MQGSQFSDFTVYDKKLCVQEKKSTRRKQNKTQKIKQGSKNPKDSKILGKQAVEKAVKTIDDGSACNNEVHFSQKENVRMFLQSNISRRA